MEYFRLDNTFGVIQSNCVLHLCLHLICTLLVSFESNFNSSYLKEIATILDVSAIWGTVHGTPSAPCDKELNASVENFQFTSIMKVRGARQTS